MNKFFLYLFLITLSFPFNINNASDDDWNTLSNVISNEKINSIKNHILLNGNIENIPESLKGRHSLDAWGYRLGENKGSYDKGWDVFSDEMLRYCIQDVKVTSILWKLISSKL